MNEDFVAATVAWMRRGAGTLAMSVLIGGWALVASPSASGQMLMELTSSTFVGGAEFDRAQGMTTDDEGFIYIHMNTLSDDLPTTLGGFNQTYSGNTDAYLAKYSPDGKELIWGTYIGARGEDRGYGVKIGPDGSVYAVGITASRRFRTTPNSATRFYQGGSSDFFVTKFTSDGELIFSSLVGGEGADWSRGNFFVDGRGAAYIGGRTDSPDFPVTRDAVQSTYAGGWDGFLVKLSPDGSEFEYSSYFGGSGNDATYSGVYVSPSDSSIFFAGMTNSTDFPVTPNAMQTTYGGGEGVFDLGDAFVVRLTPEADEMIYSTYIGGPGNDGISKNDGMIIDAQGRAIIIGQAGEGFPISPGADQTTYGGGLTDGFVGILSADGTRLERSTYLGGEAWEEPSGVDLDEAGNIFLSGNTGSTDFPTTDNAFQTEFAGGPTDMLLTVYEPNLRLKLYSSYIGGSGQKAFGDRGRSLEIVDGNLLLLAGDTNSFDFPTLDAAQPEFGGVADGAILQWRFFLPGDANADRTFSTADLIQVLALGQYEDSIDSNSTWESGDWNGDGDFTTSDLVVALQINIFIGLTDTLAATPEPSAIVLFAAGIIGLAGLRRRTG